MAAVTRWVIVANIAFASNQTNRRNNLLSQLEQKIATKPTWRSWTVTAVEGKFGGGPGLTITARFENQADAAEIWADVESGGFGFVAPGGRITYASAEFDDVTGERLSEPVLIDSRSF